MTETEKKQASLNESTDKSATPDQDIIWNFPDVESTPSEEEQLKTNAIGKNRTWRYEPPEEPEPEPVPLTADEIEQIRQAAYEDGFNQGKEEGYSKGYDEGKATGHEDGLKLGHDEGLAKGLEHGEQQINDLAVIWQKQIDQLHQPLAVLETNVEVQLLELVMQLTEAVVLQEAKTNPDILMSAITAGIKSLPSQDSQTQILLNPLDISIVEQQFGEAYVKEQGWRLLAAPQFEQGSCQIENSTSNIDIRVKSRLKQVLESFLHDALHQK
ncbi:flagellar assembly protein FliH [Thalassotalea atypica]|uniref:flagellar assembly protein FliH n=1 Tax=Thalassotalea atypica TaxID=2054316 RepID=UPI0025747CCE|nr:flagellar assembly protein FliH [Thalassotalea atypica]